MSNNIAVNFKVSGSELSAYIDTIQKKSDALTNSAIKGAIEQSDKAKEQLKIINEQITALERKSKLETQASRSILGGRRDEALKRNQEEYEGQKQGVYEDKSLSDSQIKDKITAIEGVQASSADKIKSDYRENLSAIKEQERSTKLQTQLSRDAIQTAKEAARENIKAIKSGDQTLADVYREVEADGNEEEKLTLRLIEDGLEDEKRRGGGDKKDGKSILGSLLGVDNLNKLIGSAGQFAQTQNGFDLIQPASNMAGRIIGGIIGGIVGTIAEPGGGTVVGAGIGASIGGGLGDALGTFEQREALTKENFFKARNRYRAITGANTENIELPDTANVGVDAIQFLQQQAEYAKRRGTANGSAQTATDAIYAERGYGVDSGTSAALVEIQRGSKESNRDLGSLIAGILEKGQGGIFKNGDTTFLNEFLGKFASLQKELLKTQGQVPTGVTMELLNAFNKIGGMFDLRDPRAMGNISSIQGSLSNPGSDNMKALAFRILSEQNPNSGMFDIREKVQGGYGTPGYLKGVLKFIDSIGGGDQMKMNNLSGAFAGLPLAAIRQLFNNRESLENGTLSVDDLQAKFPGAFKGRAEANTTDLEKNEANINQGILGGKAVEEMADAFVVAIKAMLGGAVITLNDNKGTITLQPKAPAVRQNVTKTTPKAFEDRPYLNPDY